MSFIEFRNVCKEYQMGEQTIRAVDDVSFSIEQGEFCVIVGASGAGKTTILNMLGGIDNCSSGKILLDGAEVSAFDAKRLTQYRRYDVGFVFQFYNLIPDLTVEENIQVVSDIAENPLDITEVLEAMDMEKYRYHIQGGAK